jgi:hypothetical protein
MSPSNTRMPVIEPKLIFLSSPVSETVIYFLPSLHCDSKHSGNHMGGQLKLIKQLFPPTPKWGVDHIPALPARSCSSRAEKKKKKNSACAHVLNVVFRPQAVMLVSERKQSRWV